MAEAAVQDTPIPRFFCHKCSVEIPRVLPVSWSAFTFYWNMTYNCDLNTCVLIVILPVDEGCILWPLQQFVIEFYVAKADKTDVNNGCT